MEHHADPDLESTFPSEIGGVAVGVESWSLVDLRTDDPEVAARISGLAQRLALPEEAFSIAVGSPLSRMDEIGLSMQAQRWRGASADALVGIYAGTAFPMDMDGRTIYNLGGEGGTSTFLTISGEIAFYIYADKAATRASGPAGAFVEALAKLPRP